LSYAIAVLLGMLVAASTVPFALIRVWINDRTIKAAERTTNAAEQGLITDRINTAVTGLGVEKTVKQTAPNGKITENTDANIEVRLGAIYALERLSQDSDRDHMQIMEILCAYIRTNAPWDKDTDVPWDLETPGPFKRLRADIQAALTVIGRRAPDKIALERTKGFVLDLRDADLRGTDLRDGDFAQAWFWRSNFQFAVLVGTNLKGANLWDADLSGATLIKTRFDAKTNLKDTTFDKAIVFNTDFSNTSVTQMQLSQMFASVDTRVPPGLTRPTHWSDKTLPRDEFFNAYAAWWGDQHPTPPPDAPDTPDVPDT
ncbi:MAG: pentapeptide repeat-containing protein, partial [Paracoccaceae bacterium]|nr:pentapeptide repeat-containing protein [Paracoccaceae bacterium]